MFYNIIIASGWMRSIKAKSMYSLPHLFVSRPRPRSAIFFFAPRHSGDCSQAILFHRFVIWSEWQGWITYCACPWHQLFTQRSRTGQPHGGYTFATWKSSDKLTKEKFCEYVRSASLVKEFLSKPGIKENAFDPLGEVFHCFDPKFYHKDDWEEKNIAGVLATFLHWYVNDLL